VSLEFALGMLHNRLEKVVVFSGNLIEMNNKLSKIRPKAILPLDQLSKLTSESLRQVFPQDFNEEQDLLIAASRSKIITEMN
jgi:hypothetical protein